MTVNTMRKKLIIDVDTGNDDALAIMLAVQHPDMEVLAITCVNGNTTVDNVCRNTLRVLDVCGKSDIPVFRGAEKPLLSQMEHGHYYGHDGLGDCEWSEQIDMNRIQKEHAVLALIRLVNQFAGEITLVVLGPMTNIALAIRLDPKFGDKLKEVFVMGGNTEGHGNVTRAAEFNFVIDPESVDICLRDLHKLVHLSPWETVVGPNAFPWDMYDKFINMGTRKSAFIGKIFTKCNKNSRKRELGFRPCDLIAVAAVVDYSIVTTSVDLYAVIELNGQLTRGQIVADHRGLMNMAPNVRVFKTYDMERITELTLNVLR